MKETTHAVITGDIISSSTYSLTIKEKALQELRTVLSGYGAQMEVYRGDSFQALHTKPIEGLDLMLHLQAAVGGIEPGLACRMALGLGAIESFSGKALEGDGEAFRNSGPYLDKMKKDQRFIITTPWPEVNDELLTECKLADAITSRWTVAQAETITGVLQGLNQNNLAERLNITQSAVNQRLRSASWDAIDFFRKRYMQLITARLK